MRQIREMHQMRQISPTFCFGSSGGKSATADPLLMVATASFEICAKCVKSAQLFFFGPSGGKSDAADPFSIVPRSISEISGRHVSRCLGGNREAKSISHSLEALKHRSLRVPRRDSRSDNNCFSDLLDIPKLRQT